jgi:hypothetical protein
VPGETARRWRLHSERCDFIGIVRPALKIRVLPMTGYSHLECDRLDDWCFRRAQAPIGAQRRCRG